MHSYSLGKCKGGGVCNSKKGGGVGSSREGGG